MDRYKQLMCIKGLIISMDEERYKCFQKDLLTEELNKKIVNSFYTAIQDFLESYEGTDETT